MHKIAAACAKIRTIDPAFSREARVDPWSVPISDVPGKFLDGRITTADVAVTSHTDRDYYAGAYQDLCTRTTSTHIFGSPIYFHPALMQRTDDCLPDLDDEDRNDMVAIPVSTQPVWKHNPVLGNDDTYYRLYVDLYRPTAKVENGAVYMSGVERVDNYKLRLGPQNTVGLGDVLFVGKDTGSVDLYKVINDEYEPHDPANPDASKWKIVDLDPEGSLPLPDEINVAGWVIEEDEPEKTYDSVMEMLEAYRRQSTIQFPIFAGVCGPLQPIVLDMVLLQYVLILTANAKLIVDYNFYHLRDWLAGDPIVMHVGHPTDSQEYRDATSNTPEKVNRLEVRYRYVDAPEEPNWITVWKKTIGTFIIEGDGPSHYTAWIVLSGPGPGTPTH